VEALRQSFDPTRTRFLACDFWQGSDANCDLFQSLAGIGFPVLLNAHVLGAPSMYNCSYHYCFVIDGEGVVQYRGSVNIPALTIVLQQAIDRLPTGTPVEDVPASATLLGANFPNPFNPSTSIPYEVPADRDGGLVRLDVLDLRGRVVRTLVSGAGAVGRHVAAFDGLDARGNRLPSGSYLSRLRVGDLEATRVMTMIK